MIETVYVCVWCIVVLGCVADAIRACKLFTRKYKARILNDLAAPFFSFCSSGCVCVCVYDWPDLTAGMAHQPNVKNMLHQNYQNTYDSHEYTPRANNVNNNNNKNK